MTSPPDNIAFTHLCQLASDTRARDGYAKRQDPSKTDGEHVVATASMASGSSSPDSRSRFDSKELRKPEDVTESGYPAETSKRLDIRRIQYALSPASVKTFAPILRGLSSDRKYRVTTESDDKLFVKIFEATTDGHIATNASNEIEWTVWAAAQRLGPDVIFFSAEQGILITRHVTNEMGRDGDSKLEPRLSATFATIAALHNSKDSEIKLHYPVEDPTLVWMKGAFARLTPEQQELPFVQLGMNIARASVTRLSLIPYRVVPIHGDFHHGNVVYAAGRAWLIDWAWSREGDAMQDLAWYAQIAEFYGFSQLEELLRRYDAALSQADVERARCHFALTHVLFYSEVLLTTSPEKAQWRRKRLRALEADLIEDGQWLGGDCMLSGFADAVMPAESADLLKPSGHPAPKPAQPHSTDVHSRFSDGIKFLDLQRIQQTISPTRVKSCEPIVLGQSGDRKYRVTAAENTQYFAKVFDMETNGSLKPLARNEITVSVWAGTEGFGPLVVAYDTQQGILITEYLKNGMGDWKEGGKEPRLSATLCTMRSLHASRVIAAPCRRTIREEIAHWEAECGKLTLQQKRMPFSQFMRKIVNACAIELEKNAPLRFAFCHNDCHQCNVRFDRGKAWLVDWASAGPGDPMKEVGYFACQVGCHGSMDFESLVNKYDAALSPNDIRRARCYFAWTHAYWYLADLRETSPDDGQDRARRLQAIEPDLIDDGLWLGLEEIPARTSESEDLAALPSSGVVSEDQNTGHGE